MHICLKDKFLMHLFIFAYTHTHVLYKLTLNIFVLNFFVWLSMLCVHILNVYFFISFSLFINISFLLRVHLVVCVCGQVRVCVFFYQDGERRRK